MMKPVFASLVMVLILTADPVESESAVSFTRVGVTFGGTGLVSARIEQHLDDYSLRLNTGIFEWFEICSSLTVNGYFGDGEFRPHAGVGLWNVSIFPEGKFGCLNFLNMPVGLDWMRDDGHQPGAEIDLNYFMSGRNPGGGPVAFSDEGRFLPLPAFYYKYRLQD